MKKHVILGVLGLAVTSVFTSCSKGSDLYDAGTVQQNQQEQKIAQLRKTYSDAFTKEFGTIASNNAWGFDQTTGRSLTRTSLDKTREAWIVPENFKNARITKEGNAANALESSFNTRLPQTFEGFDFNNYWLQHVEMPQNVKVSIIRLEAYNSKEGKWEKVLNFDGGKNETDFEFLSDDDEIEGSPITAESTNFVSGKNKTVPCATLMTDMGGSADPQTGKMFRVYQAVKGKMNKVTYSYNYDYYFLKNFEYYKNAAQNISGDFLGFLFTSTNNGKSSFWCIKIAEAQKEENPVLAEGRVLCEDMGANDFDFNDVVFDATIMRTGEIKIKVLAHGGKLPIAIGGVDVTLPQMTNTGLASAPIQEFTIPAGRYSNINDIPVTVDPYGSAGVGYDLTSVKGSAPQKVCVPVNTKWPVEYTRIDAAYTPFTSFVSTSSPAEWMCSYVSDKVCFWE